MSILKATLRHTLRRKWKLPLVVFLSGVALVALTNTYDVAGLTEAMEAVAEASRENPGGQPSPEQLATIQGGAGMLFLFTALRLLFFFGVILVGFLMPGGLVANERQSGAIMLWAQHPMPITRFYLHRYLGIQVANLTAQALFGITAVLALFPRTAVPASDLKFLRADLHVGCTRVCDQLRSVRTRNPPRSLPGVGVLRRIAHGRGNTRRCGRPGLVRDARMGSGRAPLPDLPQ